MRSTARPVSRFRGKKSQRSAGFPSKYQNSSLALKFSRLREQINYFFVNSRKSTTRLLKTPPTQTGILCVLWLLHSLLVVLICYANPNHYTTVDSWYYFEYVEWLESGLPHKAQFVKGTFPPAYPLCIVFLKSWTGLSSLWASKAVNMAASAFLFHLFSHLSPFRHSVWLASILFLGPFLKLWAHSWSEPVFLVLLYWWALRMMTHRQFDTQLAVIGLALLLTRYAGAFIIALALLKSLNGQHRGDLRFRQLWLFYAATWSSGLLLLWLLNLAIFDDVWGGNRFQLPTFSFLVPNFCSFLIGLANELLLFRNLTVSSLATPLVLFTLIQLPLLKLLTQSGIHQPLRREKAAARQITAVAAAYLIFLFTLRCFSPFDTPGYRLLSPFTLLMLAAAAGCYFPETPKAKVIWIVIVLLSWTDLLPYYDSGLKIRGLLPH